MTGITFSVPNYKVAGRLPLIAAQRTRRQEGDGRSWRRVPGCSKRRLCRATVYDLGVQHSPRLVAKSKAVLTVRLSTAVLALKVRATRLPRGHRYLLVVRAAKSHKLIASRLGTVR